MGLVQTPQSFYNPDPFQFNLYAEQGIPNEQDFISREVNILRNAVAYTGSNTVISRQGMVDMGGFPLNTITEDFETSIRLQQEGYITYATQEVQAVGQTATTIPNIDQTADSLGEGHYSEFAKYACTPPQKTSFLDKSDLCEQFFILVVFFQSADLYLVSDSVCLV
ncbi:glycosyltransferase family 2 protein [Paenibacillus macerans]|uniref:glycosyltransferase family 2 protein n=1 Tax=Paenibacillus macerans TaxID=44252 RepID=UPI003A523039